MNKQDESYLDSLLEGISVDEPEVKRPAANRKNRKTEDMQPKLAEVVPEPEIEDDFSGLDDLTELDELKLDDLKLDELDLSGLDDLGLEDFNMDLTMDEIMQNETEPMAEPDMSQDEPEMMPELDIMSQDEPEVMPELDIMSQDEPEVMPELDIMALNGSEVSQEENSSDADADILDLLSQVDAGNEPIDDGQSEPDIFMDEVGMSGEIGLSDVDEIDMSGEIGLTDEIDMSGEIGLTDADEIDMSGEIGLTDEIDMSGEIGLTDEIGAMDELGFGGDESPFDILDFMQDGLSDSLDTDEMTASELTDIGVMDGVEFGETSETKENKKSSLTGIFHKLFDNVPDKGKGAESNDLLPEGVTMPEEESEEARKAEKAKKAALKAEQKAAKKAKKEAAKKNKEAAKKAKQEAKQSKKAAAAKLTKEVAESEETGRINRVGATVVLSFFVILAVFALYGLKSSSYALSVQGAEREFNLQHYTDAYYEISGVEVKPKDMELYDKIMTVMFVNKQLNSYNNFYVMEDYPQALDSLLKGLERYDKYLALAQELGVESDLNYVRDQMLAELERVYGLKERDAVNLTEIQDIMEYSVKVYEVASTVQPEPKEEYVP